MSISWDDVNQTHQAGTYNFGVCENLDPAWYPSEFEIESTNNCVQRCEASDLPWTAEKPDPQQWMVRFMPKTRMPPGNLFVELLYTTMFAEAEMAPTIYGARIVVIESCGELFAKMVLFTEPYQMHLGHALTKLPKSDEQRATLEAQVKTLLSTLATGNFVCMDMKAANIVVNLTDVPDVRLIDFDPMFCGSDYFFDGSDKVADEMLFVGNFRGASQRWQVQYNVLRKKLEPKEEETIRYAVMVLVLYISTEEFLEDEFMAMHTKDGNFAGVPIAKYELLYNRNAFYMASVLSSYTKFYTGQVPTSFRKVLELATA